jgi:hypothetical protein
MRFVDKKKINIFAKDGTELHSLNNNGEFV